MSVTTNKIMPKSLLQLKKEQGKCFMATGSIYSTNAKYFVINNPSGSGKDLHIYDLTLVGGWGVVVQTISVSDTAVTVLGSSTTNIFTKGPNNVLYGSPVSSVAEISYNYSGSPSLTEIAYFHSGQGNIMKFFTADDTFTLPPDSALIIECTLSAGTARTSLSCKWYEDLE